MMDTEGARLRITKAGILKSTDEYEIEGHKTLLMYTLVNLIQNAIKFTTPKRSPSSSMRPLEITISVDEEAGDLWFSVADTGIGMTKEQEARCLGTQAKRFNNEIQGSGSGLSSIRSALNKVGGHITVTSILGEGTLFKFKLPLVIKRKLTLIESFQPEGALQDNSDYSNLLILAVDDQKLNQRLFGKYFSTLRIPLQNIFIVSTAEEARLVFKRQRQLKRPIDVVFTDINLGEGDDGILLAESLRVDEKAHPELKPVSIFVISGSQCPQTIAVNGSFLKPMSMEKIKSAFHVVLNDSEMRRLDDAMEGMSPKQIPQGEEITFRVLY